MMETWTKLIPPAKLSGKRGPPHLREDPRIIRRTRFDTLAGILDLMRDARVEAGRVRGPVLVLLGDLDLHVPRDGVAALLLRLPTNRRLALYPEGRHLLMRSLAGER